MVAINDEAYVLKLQIAINITTCRIVSGAMNLIVAQKPYSREVHNVITHCFKIRKKPTGHR